MPASLFRAYPAKLRGKLESLRRKIIKTAAKTEGVGPLVPLMIVWSFRAASVRVRPVQKLGGAEMKLEELAPGQSLSGIEPTEVVAVVAIVALAEGSCSFL